MSWLRMFKAFGCMVSVAVCVVGHGVNSHEGGSTGGKDYAPALKLVAVGQMRNLFLSNETCGLHDIPDIGLRAFRLKNGSVVAIASEAENYTLVGPNIESLHKTCRSAFHSDRDPDPSHFNDETWIAATWTDNGVDVMALGHNEYHGLAHGRCQGTAFECRYSAILHLISNNSGFSFFRDAQKPLAAVPERQLTSQKRDRGFSQPSNIFEFDGWKYVFVRASGGGRQLAATCIMRASNVFDASSWTIFDGSSFQPAAFDPYSDDVDSRALCKPVWQNGLVWSVLRLKDQNVLLALLTMVEMSTGNTLLVTSTSRDVMHWSAPQVVEGISLEWGMKCPHDPMLHYPSLLDPESTRANFDDSGPNPRLYLTAFAIRDCRGSMDRRSVVIQMHIEELMKGANVAVP